MEYQPPQTGLYTTRMKVFVVGCILLLLICLARLLQMQCWPQSTLRQGIEDLKKQREHSQQLKTIRGEIRDRKGVLLAYDDPRFSLQINYQLSQYADSRILAAMQLQYERQTESATQKSRAQARLEAGIEALTHLWGRSALYVSDMETLRENIKQMNDLIWLRRTFQAWRKRCRKSKLYLSHENSLLSVKPAEYIADLTRHVPDPNERLILITKERIREMEDYFTLFELSTDENILAAQMEFTDVKNVKIVAQGRRKYPQGAVAAQTIGWVGPATQKRDKRLFAHDSLYRYRPGDTCGREDGVEYLCEPILRGRRGVETFDLDKVLVEEVQTRFGRDVTLTLDIALQQKIEEYILSYPHQPYCKPGKAVVLIDVASADILALVSLPNYNLNSIRSKYGELARLDRDNTPLINRAINKHYKPGSTAKPLILAFGLETKQITPDEVISCPSAPAPAQWPNCLIFRKNRVGHDVLWPNKARNAIKGSCNIYFSRLASRIPTRDLQAWLFAFGYGKQIPLLYIVDQDIPEGIPVFKRRLRQAPGKISSPPVPYGRTITSMEEIPPLDPAHRRLVGMGEGELFATVLQIANSMATLARHGIAINPRLFRVNQPYLRPREDPSSRPVDLNLSEATLATILEGMDAVVNETQGTANKAFAYSDFAAQGVKVFGKTGSTEEPNNALFAGFAKDDQRRAIAIAVVVEGGESGAGDAAPLARTILQYCIDNGYIGVQAK